MLVTDKKECPFCAETIKTSAKKCIYCGEHLDLDQGRFRWLGIKGKTAWDLLSLIVIPLTLAIVGFYLADLQDQRQEGIEGTRIVEQRGIEETRTAAQSTVEANRANANALQSYLDDISAILLKEDLENEEVKTAAQARTVAILSELDYKRNNTVLRFLADSKMLNWILVEANLTEADLFDADLSLADLSGANLSWANLNLANLSGANLSWANLIGADLNGANLTDADLREARLYKANLIGADLNGANLTDADLSEARLNGADLHGVILSNADLIGADLNGAKYNERTQWPHDFDPEERGAIKDAN